MNILPGDQLSDYGGNVGDYMSLLQGTAAFSFKPGGSVPNPGGVDIDEEIEPEKRSFKYNRRGSGEKNSIGADFGGDYGDYLKLLEGDSALGYNPQTDPVADNQVQNCESNFYYKVLDV